MIIFGKMRARSRPRWTLEHSTEWVQARRPAEQVGILFDALTKCPAIGRRLPGKLPGILPGIWWAFDIPVRSSCHSTERWQDGKMLLLLL
jgi:hypothetical protein